MVFGVVAIILAGFMSAASASQSEGEGDENTYKSTYMRSSNKDDTDISSVYKAKSILQIGDIKSNLTDAQKKLSTDLLQLLDSTSLPHGQNMKTHKMQMKRLRQFRPASSISPATDGRGAGDMVYVYVHLKPHAGTRTIEPYVLEVTDRDEENHLAVAWVKVTDLETLASQEEVRTIRTVMPPLLRTGLITTEGDAIHHTYDVRTTHDQSGSGVKVGIISDGVDHWTDARDSGDLPADLTVLSNTQGGDEGTAMLEIVHDMVPDADLYFHDWGANTVAFNAAIDALVDAGCDVICDDVSWIDEPFFEDGIIASHLTSVLVSNDIIYVSAAGNDGEEHYQGDYYDDNGDNRHDEVLYIDFDPGSSAIIILQWNDEFGTSDNDYDLHLCDYYTEDVLDYSKCYQGSINDPIEVIDYVNEGASLVECFVVVSNYNGEAETRTLEVFIYPGNGTYVYTDNIDPADSIFGHPAVPGAIAVGAIDASDPGNDDIEPTSSQGPVTITYPLQVSRPKPDICGVDGVLISGAGDFGYWDGSNYRFYGTSAAAPHIASIAAQMWGACPPKTGDEIRTVLCDSAVDLGSTGYDNIYGYGMTDALAAFDALDCYCPPNITTSSPSSPISDTKGSLRTFGIVVNQTVNVNWYINGTPVQINASVTEASYTNTSAELGVWNVSAVASNADRTAMQTWMWNVAEIPPAFTTADAVITLEIAVGSHPYYDVAEVSGDGRVTSLDALMILQAATGRITV